MSVIKQLKYIFTETGIPRCIVLDGSTQFTSQEFKDFTKTWGIQHTVTSPTNAQSNGQADHFVQTIKNSLTKAMEGGEDPHQAILTYVTTPLNHSLQSPTELLNPRKYGCILPVQIKQQNHTYRYRNIMQKQKHHQTKYYNRNARDLPSLKTGRPVYATSTKNKKLNTRTHHRETKLKKIQNKTHNRGIYVRNRKFIKPRYTDSRQNLHTREETIDPAKQTPYNHKPKWINRRPQMLIEIIG